MDAVLILLVEDDALQRMSVEEALVDAGFKCVEAVSGKAGIHELDSDAARFQAILTDIRLGTGPNGWDVGRRARECVPDMPVVYMSGDSSHEWSANGVPDSVMISKPFAMAQVVTALATVINARASSSPSRENE